MKKFFIPFISVLGFLLCVPQNVMATKPSQREVMKNWYKSMSKYFDCYVEHKLNLPAEYKGENLKTSRRVLFFGEEYSFLGNTYLIESCGAKGLVTVNSKVYGCDEEILPVICDSDMRTKPLQQDITTPVEVVNVINVPFGSTLKYIPETKEFKVVSPDAESYKKILENFKVMTDETKQNIESIRADIGVELTEEKLADITKSMQGLFISNAEIAIFALVGLIICILIIVIIDKIFFKRRKK